MSLSACQGGGSATTTGPSRITTTAASGPASTVASKAPSSAAAASTSAAVSTDVPGASLKGTNLVPAKVGDYTADKIGATTADYKATGKKTANVIANPRFGIDRVEAELKGTQPIGKLGACGESKTSAGEYMCMLKVDSGGIMRLGGFKGITMNEMVAFAVDYVKAVGTV